VLSDLEFFPSAILGEVHGNGKTRALMESYPAVACKTGQNEAEILGLCILISDQNAEPPPRLPSSLCVGDQITWLECMSASGRWKGGHAPNALYPMSGKQFAHGRRAAKPTSTGPIGWDLASGSRWKVPIDGSPMPPIDGACSVGYALA